MPRPPTPQALARFLRPIQAALSAEIGDEIARRIASYGPGAGDQMVQANTRLAITQSVDYFIEHVRDADASRQMLDETLHRIGRGEAYNGRSLDSLRQAFEISSELAWRQIDLLAVEQGLDEQTLAVVGHELRAFMATLTEQSALGYHEAQRQLSDATQQWRGRLLDLILAGSRTHAEEIAALAAAGNWTVPDTVVLAAVRVTPGVPLPARRMLHPAALSALRGGQPSMVLLPAPVPELLDRELREQFDGHRLAFGCAVPLADAADSLRWARRALDLVDRRVLPEAPVVDCAEHIATLWIHSEPLLADIVNRTTLAPLYAEPPNSRKILGQTLLAWIETSQPSAPVIAELLDKHPQTIRYRLKRLREILGDALDDPLRLMEMYYALRASGPQWNGGEPAPAADTHRVPARGDD